MPSIADLITTQRRVVEVDLKGLGLPLDVVIRVVNDVVGNKYDDVKIDYNRGVLHCYPKVTHGVGDKLSKRLEQARIEAPYRRIDTAKYIQWDDDKRVYVITPLQVFPFRAQDLRALSATLHQHRKVKGVRQDGTIIVVTTTSGQKGLSLRDWMAAAICHKAGVLSGAQG